MPERQRRTAQHGHLSRPASDLGRDKHLCRPNAHTDTITNTFGEPDTNADNNSVTGCDPDADANSYTDADAHSDAKPNPDSRRNSRSRQLNRSRHACMREFRHARVERDVGRYADGMDVR